MSQDVSQELHGRHHVLKKPSRSLQGNAHNPLTKFIGLFARPFCSSQNYHRTGSSAPTVADFLHSTAIECSQTVIVDLYCRPQQWVSADVLHHPQSSCWFQFVLIFTSPPPQPIMLHLCTIKAGATWNSAQLRRLTPDRTRSLFPLAEVVERR